MPALSPSLPKLPVAGVNAVQFGRHGRYRAVIARPDRGRRAVFARFAGRSGQTTAAADPRVPGGASARAAQTAARVAARCAADAAQATAKPASMACRSA
ncbi:hypothetical protein [Lysobacter gummosus]|uniref:hypothetical protein n=1 Tax=Lysobacter gummosus TaxID=262324 RepID=UPI00362F12E3